MALGAGRFRNTVVLEQRSDSREASGEAVQGWTAVATLPAQATMPGGTERFVSELDRVVATVTHRVRIRYRSGVNPALHRLRLEGRVLELLSATDPDGRRRELVCMCREVIA